MAFGIMKLSSEEWLSFNSTSESSHVVLAFLVSFLFLIATASELARKCDFKPEAFLLSGDKLEEAGRRRVLPVFGSKQLLTPHRPPQFVNSVSFSIYCHILNHFLFKKKHQKVRTKYESACTIHSSLCGFMPREDQSFLTIPFFRGRPGGL